MNLTIMFDLLNYFSKKVFLKISKRFVENYAFYNIKNIKFDKKINFLKMPFFYNNLKKITLLNFNQSNPITHITLNKLFAIKTLEKISFHGCFLILKDNVSYVKNNILSLKFMECKIKNIPGISHMILGKLLNSCIKLKKIDFYFSFKYIKFIKKVLNLINNKDNIIALTIWGYFIETQTKYKKNADMITEFKNLENLKLFYRTKGEYKIDKFQENNKLKKIEICFDTFLNTKINFDFLLSQQNLKIVEIFVINIDISQICLLFELKNIEKIILKNIKMNDLQKIEFIKKCSEKKIEILII